MTVLLLWVVFVNGQAVTYQGQHASPEACEAAMPTARAQVEKIVRESNPQVIRQYALACARLTPVPQGPAT